eukprot:TRINITY_DN25305_c0_g1_i1.p1 TRINITY_DN25305_c0_g1~~TRINITY_DN25305_c0_g1_i1.p1  ORF type:complete len:207 (+),score=69.10 TRINITY_DN25305_c0_g1_i1:165-785(+)
MFPAPKHAKDARVKLVTPSCAEYHAMERAVNTKQKEYNSMLRLQVKRALAGQSLLSSHLAQTTACMKRLEAEREMVVAEEKETLSREHRMEISSLQDQVAELEKKCAAEKKKLTDDIEMLTLRVDSLISEVVGAESNPTLRALYEENERLRRQLAQKDLIDPLSSTAPSQIVRVSSSVKLKSRNELIPASPLKSSVSKQKLQRSMM